MCLKHQCGTVLERPLCFIKALGDGQELQYYLNNVPIKFNHVLLMNKSMKKTAIKSVSNISSNKTKKVSIYYLTQCILNTTFFFSGDKECSSANPTI